MVGAGSGRGRQAPGVFSCAFFTEENFKFNLLSSEEKHFYWEITLWLTLKFK